MVTGKANREEFAKISVHNFDRQTFARKYLVIVNHGTNHILPENTANKVEIMMEKTSLGNLRNAALELVPPHAVWTTWDDDDWRSDDYLSVLFGALDSDRTKRNLMFTRRIDHNLNNNFTYQVYIPSGTFIFFCYKDPMLQYAELDTKEDANVKQYLLREMLSKTMVYDNDPRLYIRFIHKNNSSVYLDNTKSKITKYSNMSPYFELEATDGHSNYVKSTKKKYYNNK